MTENQEEFNKSQAFASKGKVRLFGFGARTKGLIAAGLLSAAALIPQTAEARPGPSRGFRQAQDIVAIVTGGLYAAGGLAKGTAARLQQSQVNDAMKKLVAEYQGEIQGLNEEYAAYTQQGGYTDQAVSLQVKRYLARNDANIARGQGKKDLAQAYENRAAAYAKRAVAMDSILSNYANQLVKPAKDGLFHEDEIVTTLTANRAGIDKARLTATEQKAAQIRAQYNQAANKLALIARQNQMQIQTSNWQTMMGTTMILGPSFHLYDMNHKPSHRPLRPQPRYR